MGTVGTINCIGTQSCHALSVVRENYSPTCNIKCHGERSCLDSNLGGGSVSCSGIASCHGATLKAPIVSCESSGSCIDTILDGVQRLDLLGENDLGDGVSISGIPVINGYGIRSLLNAKISTNTVGLTVVLAGHETGYGATITCDDGQICILKCKGNGCQHTIFNCLEGSSCTVHPFDCTQANSGQITKDGVVCPLFTEWVDVSAKCIAQVYANGDNTMKISHSIDGGDTFQEIDTSSSYLTTTINRMRVTDQTVLKFVVTDTRSTKERRNTGG
eukprot:450740_1